MIGICVPGFILYVRILFPVNCFMASPFGNLIGTTVGDMENEALKSSCIYCL